MPAISSSAPGKVILCGEHAVVYGKPAIAVPVFDVSSVCHIIARPAADSNEIHIVAPGIGLRTQFSNLPDNHPIRKTILSVLESLNLDHLPNCEIQIHSSVPSAAGMGSSASTSVALIRAISTFLGQPLADLEVNRIAFEIEKFHHGTPSGIDNTVITFGKPIYFTRNLPYEILRLQNSLTLVIADSGIKSSTAKVVTEVRNNWETSKQKYEKYFNQIQEISIAVKATLESRKTENLGELLNHNHSVLSEMGISCPQLDTLVRTARANGALGAKLSGGGQGGNMLALVTPENAELIALALRQAGAVNTIITRVPAEGKQSK